MKYNYSTSDKETIFGLSPADLTTEQLKKVVPNKLIDFLYDSRVEDILVENLNSYVIDSESDIRIDLHWLACFEESEWSKFKKIKRAYLDLCDRTNLFSAVRNGYNREACVFWPALEFRHQVIEYERYVCGQHFASKATYVDFAEICEFDINIARRIMTTAFENKTMINTMIAKCNADLLTEFIPRIQALSNSYRLHLLENPNTPVDLLDGILRVAAKVIIHHVPTIRVPIPTAVLENLPPVTRLEVIERIAYRSSNISTVLFDIKTEDDFRMLTFACLSRHTNRVMNVLAKCKGKFKVQDELTSATNIQPVSSLQDEASSV
jgi:hypothetical protein